ncbi:MAG: hypothetical protein U0M02_10970 [Acutalibacteraceae bacterium]|nr:hypothetical protein [Acutalibacteraceae bacterium]
MIMSGRNHTDYMASRIADTEECLNYVQRIGQIIDKEYSENSFRFTEADDEFYKKIHEHTDALIKLLEIKRDCIERAKKAYDEVDSKLTEMAKSFE